MAAPTETYIDPTAGNDHGGATFTDGSFANATNTLTKVGAFPAATCKVGAWLLLGDNGSGEVTAGYYRVTTRSSDDAVVLHADIRSGVNDPTDVTCTQHDGTINLPWKSLQFALNQTTRDSTNGDRMNVKAGAGDNIGEVLLETLNLTTYGTPTEAVPLIVQGYTSTAGDGGVGEIDGGGSYGCFAGTESHVHVLDMHIHNGGAAILINVAAYSTVHNCEVHDTTGIAVNTTTGSRVTGCNIYDGSSIAIMCAGGALITGNYIANGAVKKFTSVVSMQNIGAVVERNIISIDGTTSGIALAPDYVSARHNTILSSNGTGEAIYFSNGAKFNRVVENNYIEGFSGAGGDGIDFDSISENGTIYRNNAFFNNTKPVSAGDESGYVAGELLIEADNQYLEATALAKSGDNTFANRFIYFAPKAAIQGKAYPDGANLDIGAVQHADPAGGGGGPRVASMNGGLS